MQTSPRTFGRRDALRGCVGLAATTAVAAESGIAQTEDNGTATPDEPTNESAANGTATNETDGNASAETGEPAEDEPAGNATANETTADAPANQTASDPPANETAAGGSAGDTTGSAGSLSTGEITAVFGGILAAALLSPLLFALLLRTVYEDDNPAGGPPEHRP